MYPLCVTTVCTSLHPDRQRSETSWYRRISTTPSLADSPQSENVAKRVPADKRNLSMTDRLEDLNIDSFSAVEMIYDLEEKFDLEFPIQFK